MNSPDIIFGIRALLEAIKSGKEIDKVLVKKGLQGELFFELFNEMQERKIPFQYVPIEKINRVTRKNHQGVVAYISAVTYYNIEQLLPSVFESGKVPLLLVLDGISDVRNFGAIARTAECAGVNAIIIPEKGAAQVNADAIKTSAGALHTMPVCRSHNLAMTVKFLKDSGIQIFAATEKAEKSVYDVDFKGPTAIIMGAEDSGVQKELLRLADELVSIPILGAIQSLNVSVAAAILSYEAVRQRGE